VLVLRCQWRATEDESPARTAGRQVAGATIAALATGNVVTESASSPRTWPLSPPNWTACAAPNPSPASTRKPFASSRWRRCAPFGTCPATSVSTRQSPIPLAVPRRCRPSTLRPARAHWTLADALPDARYVCGVIRRGRGGLVIAPLVLVTSQHTMVPVRNHPPERAQLPGPVLRLDPGHHRRLVPAHILRTEPGPPTRQRRQVIQGLLREHAIRRVHRLHLRQLCAQAQPVGQLQQRARIEQPALRRLPHQPSATCPRCRSSYRTCATCMTAVSRRVTRG